MGAWGAGLWSDDTAADLRLAYCEALEDGLSDEAAEAKVLATFAPDLADADSAPVMWLALVMSQHLCGRLSDDVRDQAVAVIDSGADRRRWAHLDSRMRARREAVLTRLRAQLTGLQRGNQPAHDSRDDLTWRCRTAIWWRSARISAFLAVSEQGSRVSQPPQPDEDQVKQAEGHES